MTKRNLGTIFWYSVNGATVSGLGGSSRQRHLSRGRNHPNNQAADCLWFSFSRRCCQAIGSFECIWSFNLHLPALTGSRSDYR